MLFAPAVSTTAAAALLPMPAATAGSAPVTTAFPLAAMFPEVAVLVAATLPALSALATVAMLGMLALLPRLAALPISAAPATARLVRPLRPAITALILRRRIRLPAAAFTARIAPRLLVGRNIAVVVTSVVRMLAAGLRPVTVFSLVARALIAIVTLVFTLRRFGGRPGVFPLQTLLAPTLWSRSGLGRAGGLKMGTFRFRRPIFARCGRRRRRGLFPHLPDRRRGTGRG